MKPLINFLKSNHGNSDIRGIGHFTTHLIYEIRITFLLMAGIQTIQSGNVSTTMNRKMVLTNMLIVIIQIEKLTV